MKQKVLIIGWDSADWNILNPLLDSGKMPHLEKFINEGASGKIATLDPPLSPMLWTSIATGMRPFKHGISGFVEPDEEGKKIRPVQVSARKVKAVWNILQQNGLKSHVVGWWPSHPAEPISGVMVSNQFSKSSLQHKENWVYVPQSVNHQAYAEDLCQLRVHPLDITANHLSGFVNDISSINQLKDNSLYKIATNLAETATTQNVATFLMDIAPDWDFMGVYFESIDLICHHFMRFTPPRMKHISEKSYEHYKDVVDGFYQLHDRMLGYMLEKIPEDCTVIITSDHGFKSGKQRMFQLPKEPAAIAREHAHHGFFAIKGPGIKKDERIYGASILDITPTILHIFGLPIAKDMDGKPLLNIFEKAVPPQYIPSWESVQGISGQLSDIGNMNNSYDFRDAAHVQHLEDLGYIESGSHSNTEEKIRSIIRENQFYLGRSYFCGRYYSQALEIFEEIHNDAPEIKRYQQYLANTYLKLNKTQKVKALFDKIALDLQEWNPEWMAYILGYYNLESKFDKTIALYKKHRLKFEASEILLSKVIFAGLHDRTNISLKKIIEKLLQLNPNNQNAYYYKGLIFLEEEKYEQAIEEFLNCIGLSYFQPTVHYNLAKALMEAEYYEEAAGAAKVAINQAPAWQAPMNLLKKIYHEKMMQPELYDAFNQQLIQTELPLIYVVSGLPRSGTSLMMQMLEAAGLNIYTDFQRSADENNPKGYYETEAVKQMHLRNNWLIEVKDKAIKVVAQQLPFLPDRFRYKVIFMNRNIENIAKSQCKMLERAGKIPYGSTPLFLEQALSKDKKRALQWMEERMQVAFIEIQFENIFNNFDEEWTILANFLNLPDEKKAAIKKVIDTQLYREKTT